MSAVLIKFPITTHMPAGSTVTAYGDATTGSIDYTTALMAVPVWPATQRVTLGHGLDRRGQEPRGGVVGSQGHGCGLHSQHRRGKFQDVVFITVEAPVGTNLFGAKFFNPAGSLLATASPIGPVIVS